MSEHGDRRIAAVLGLLGGLLIGLDGLFDLAQGVIYLGTGHGMHALVPVDQGVVDLFVALLIVLFSWLGGMRSDDRPIMAGAVLLVLAVVGWFALGLGSGLLALLGVVLMLVAAVVFLASSR